VNAPPSGALTASPTLAPGSWPLYINYPGVDGVIHAKTTSAAVSIVVVDCFDLTKLCGGYGSYNRSGADSVLRVVLPTHVGEPDMGHPTASATYGSADKNRRNRSPVPIPRRPRM